MRVKASVYFNVPDDRVIDLPHILEEENVGLALAELFRRLKNNHLIEVILPLEIIEAP